MFFNWILFLQDFFDIAHVSSFLDTKAVTTNKYVAPYLRDGGAGRGTGREPPGARRDDVAAIRISNLSNFAVEADLEDLVKGFGPVQKLYLAKEKVYLLLFDSIFLIH